MNLFKSTKATTYISSRGDKVYPIIMDIKAGIVEGDAVFTTGDIETAYLYVTILEEQSDYDILGSTVICNIQRPNGTTMKVQGDVLGNNLIEFPLGQSGVAQEGIYNFDIAVVFSEKKMVTSPTAQYSVTQSIEVNGELEEDDRFPVLESLISGLNVINEEELVRISNEEDRQANETVRQNQEVTRKNQEQARVTAEGNRVTSENVRVSAEQARVLKEQERQAIEVERQNSESTREQQEAIRVSQEDARKQADILRQQEHESRQQFLNGFEGKLNTVVDDVATIKDDVVSVREANKRQDVFLQGLYNENLDGRVTIKEEGSVISLTNSDDGLVDIVGLEGNTLVNYVQDGAKELTLNGDIEAEGTNVTLTDTVDNGLVDVACEGNTLVNLVPSIKNGWYASGSGIDNTLTVKTDTSIKVSKTKNGSAVISCEDSLKLTTTNKTYTITFDLLKTFSNDAFAIFIRYNDGAYYRIGGLQTIGKNKISFTHKAGKDIANSRIVFGYTGGTEDIGEIEIENIVLLEGDWTDKEIPPYFEGMKSVAECEDNKIEIVSQNKNLFDGKFEQGYISGKTGLLIKGGDSYSSVNFINVKNINEITISYTSADVKPTIGVARYDENYNFINFFQSGVLSQRKQTVDVSNCHYIKFRLFQQVTDISKIISCQVEEGSVETNYVQHLSNKKQITLSEPLRGLPNGVCDKIVKIGGKWYIQRRLYGITLNGGENEKWIFELDWSGNSGELSRFLISIPNQKYIRWHDLMRESKNYSINNRFNVLDNLAETFALEVEHFSGWDLGKFVLNIKTSRLSIENELGLKQWLSENPIELVYELETPIYEELSIDPTLNTYNDITHISNNSTIPCNMQVKNTGYNAIIKPSTQYTVAFDSNASGEVGINLAGSKVTTNNNVATITTPSTLVDDSLRLTGKGIKASKVRLLESDKTNWIPSYFEGMKSSFEDKLQDDGTYKMEILSNNKNLFDAIFKENILKNTQLDIRFKDGKMLVNGSMPHHYMFKVVIPKGTYFASGLDNNIFLHVFWQGGDSGFTSNKRSVTYLMDTEIQCYLSRGEYTNYECSFQLELGETVTDFIPSISNKIQFSSIEPLRGVGDVKDRFVFKEDGKLMIERNCGYLKVKTSELGNSSNYSSSNSSVKGAMYSIPEYHDIAVQSHYATGFSLRTNTEFRVVYSNGDGLYVSGAYAVGMSKYKTENRTKLVFKLPSKNGMINTHTDVDNHLKNTYDIIEIVYPLENTVYEEIPLEAQKIILEGYLNGTLFLDTNIPPTVEASYTANIPLVNELNKNSNEIGLTQEDLSVTQVAVDFLLMSNLGEEMLSSFNINTRGRNSMASYFANRIIKGALKYEDVISKYPHYKEELDSILETK